MQEKISVPGGLRWGESDFGANVTFPFARLEATEDEIVISVTTPSLGVESWAIPSSNVVSVKRRRGILSAGIQVVHSVADYPSVFIFGSFSARKVISHLMGMGYKVE